LTGPPIAGQPSAAFAGLIGIVAPVSTFAKRDYLMNATRFPSEGNWAFCRFDSAEVPAVRLGFQKGGFNGGAVDRVPSPRYLQLHLEVMTRDGAILWLPSGIYAADSVVADPEAMDIELTHGSQCIFSLRGWPRMACDFRSSDGDLEVQLNFDLKSGVILPDCYLPYCLFAMWESMGNATGTVRFGDRTVAVNGKVFFDHTRILAAQHRVRARHMYVYTTLYLEDGSGLFGYHSADAMGQPIEEYCFGVFIDAEGNGRLLNDASLVHLALDEEGIAKSWKIRWRAPDLLLAADVEVQFSRILRCWGAPDVPVLRQEFSILPLVLDASVKIGFAKSARELKGKGLAEYFNANLWPADKAAITPGPNS
jgi:hypothetical protein